jgi:hypothetical protein
MIVPVTGSKFLALGLDIAGFKNWKMCNENTNMQRFQGFFEAKPEACAAIWLDLQTTFNQEGRIESNAKPLHLLLALRYLRAYPTELELSATFHMSENSVRKWVEIFVRF